MRRLYLSLLILILMAGGGWPARAQSAARVELFGLQSGSYPSISVYMNAFDAAGNFVTGLTADQVSLLEDNQPRPLTGLRELQPGTQFALALDPGPAFAFRDAGAVTRFEKVVQVIQAWAAGASGSGDDLSLVTTGVSPTTHIDAAAFSAALSLYQPNLQTLTPSLATLSTALDVVSETPPQPGMKPVVLYVTSVPSVDDIPAIQNLTQRAVSQGVRVHVWIVASQDFFTQQGATVLKDLAILTGGQSVLYSGAEPLPSLEEYLAPLRHLYLVTYDSAVLTSGGHSLTATVTLDGSPVSSPSLGFELDIQPPNPILLSPPAQIVRQAPDEKTTDTAAFLPLRQQIDLLVEFPDGRTRPLVQTALYVDGLLADENTSAPFDRFEWDLSAYAVSGQHILMVEARDSLGLSKTSIGIPVTVTVIQPRRNLLAFLTRNNLWVVFLAVVLAGGVLGLTLAWGRLQRRKGTVSRSAYKDPLTQPVQGESRKARPRLTWTRPAGKTAAAFLVRLKDSGEPVTASPIPVTTPEMTFGSDPLQATRILDDPSVSPLHARLVESGGEFTLIDEKSTAGTWVNYEQILLPRLLQHGDVLHIGRLSYRFLLQNPPEMPPARREPVKK